MYRNLLVYQLEYKCRERGLSLKGTRKDLIARLEADDEVQSSRHWAAISGESK